MHGCFMIANICYECVHYYTSASLYMYKRRQITCVSCVIHYIQVSVEANSRSV